MFIFTWTKIARRFTKNMQRQICLNGKGSTNELKNYSQVIELAEIIMNDVFYKKESLAALFLYVIRQENSLIAIGVGGSLVSF